MHQQVMNAELNRYIGTYNGEYVTAMQGGTILYRIDANSVYNNTGALVGFMDNGIARDCSDSKQILFHLVK